MNHMPLTIAFGLAVALCPPAFGQDPGDGGGQPGNGNGQGNGQNPVVLVPGFGDGGGGGGNQVDPIARALMIRDAYKNNFNVDQPFASSARSHVDAQFYQKYAIAAFDLFNTFRKRVVNEQAYIVKTFKDADRADRREQDQLDKEQTLAARRNAFSRIVEAMNALPTPKNVVATGRPLNAYLDRVNQAGSFGGLLTAGTDESFKLRRPEAIRISSGTGERAARLPVVGKTAPFNPPAFLSLDPALKAKLDRFDAARKEVWSAPTKADAVANAQDALAELDADVARRHKGMKVFAFHDENYQDSLAWKKFFGEERRLLAWAAVAPSREAFDGKTVVDLLMYLRRNGYSFAAADPGDEDAYVALHQQLRDLCVKAAEEPASGMDDRLKGFIEQHDRLRERLPPAAATTVGPPPQQGAGQ
jgi:hypothetical protein